MDRNIQRVQSRIPGSIYINLNNSADLTDNNTVIYGHNFRMSGKDSKNSMFCDLEKYYDKTFLKKIKKLSYIHQNISILMKYLQQLHTIMLIPASFTPMKKTVKTFNSLYNTNGMITIQIES